jgi:hypothetical protein
MKLTGIIKFSPPTKMIHSFFINARKYACFLLLISGNDFKFLLHFFAIISVFFLAPLCRQMNHTWTINIAILECQSIGHSLLIKMRHYLYVLLCVCHLLQLALKAFSSGFHVNLILDGGSIPTIKKCVNCWAEGN